MNKPKKCCHPDCTNCPYSDCRWHEVITDAEKNDIDAQVKLYAMEQRAAMNETTKYFRYNHSEKGKEARKRYAQSEKGKENETRKRKRKIESGKNAEYCRRYREKRKKAQQ